MAEISGCRMDDPGVGPGMPLAGKRRSPGVHVRPDRFAVCHAAIATWTGADIRDLSVAAPVY